MNDSAELEVAIPDRDGRAGDAIYFLLAIRFNRTGGSAANYALFLAEESGASDTDTTVVTSYTSDAVANGINETFAQPIPFKLNRESASDNYKLYVNPQFDGGTDNACKIVLFVRSGP